MQDFTEVWVYLSTSPLTHLTLTLVAFQVGSWVYNRSGMNPLLNPVLLSILIIIAVLFATDTGYDDYFGGAQFVHFLLGPATVALAVPLYRQFEKVRRSAVGIVASIAVGSVTASVSAVLLAWLLGSTRETLASLAPKSVTTPVAMGITEKLGGLPSLTAIMVIVTGIAGAMLGPAVLNLVRVRNMAARGLAMGTASHGIGTARAMQVDEVAGAFSGLAMGINALATALLLPLLWALVFG